MTSQYIYAGLAVFVLLLVIRSRRPSRSSLPLPPGPPGVPLIGNVLQTPKETPWVHYYEWSKKYGPVMYLNMAGQPLIIINSLKAAQDLLSRRGAHYSDRPHLVVAGDLVTKGLHILLRHYDARYRLHQRLHSPVVTPGAAINYRPLMELESRQLIHDILTNSDKDGSKGIDWGHWFERAMCSTVYALVYGYRLKTGHEESITTAKYVQAQAVKIMQPGRYLVDAFPSLNHLPGPLAPWKAEAEALWQLEVNLHLENLRRGRESPAWNIATHLSQSAEAVDMAPEELAFNVGTLADAALDTSSMTLNWLVVAWLAEGAAAAGTAKRVLDDVVGRDRMPQFDDQPRLAYIMAVVHELMRWRPTIAGGIPHRYTGAADDDFCGHRIPAGAFVIANHWGIARDESVYGPNVESFVPERWLPDADEEVDVKTNNGVKELYSTVFGYGRRVCVGQHVARQILFMTVARVLWAFDVESAVDGETGEQIVIDPLAVTPGLSIKPRPFNAIFRPRGSWVRSLIEKEGNTHSADIDAILDQIAVERSGK
ncbi:hypothetical protein PFICI_11673 [Pestalotiopsis fici W106-1]|uniref:Cytochrome P450 n=1 Tax=Pestalotiopsis fici (strain W106-1 / CGMCC3.15140) TaxID=1229662 RepID=W3WTX6_PESFW|nr:uncharacterized protein PFICI_11673 [Pestalotiopsis fici W106-1]ETS76286.1 hypothetical protein PFICI_11673 [Pestalotiopsis fici W106-1]